MSKWDPICECGNFKAVGKATCTACKKAHKALRKGNLRRFDAVCAGSGVGEFFDGKPYLLIKAEPGTPGILVEQVAEGDWRE